MRTLKVNLVLFQLVQLHEADRLLSKSAKSVRLASSTSCAQHDIPQARQLSTRKACAAAAGSTFAWNAFNSHVLKSFWEHLCSCKGSRACANKPSSRNIARSCTNVSSSSDGSYCCVFCAVDGERRCGVCAPASNKSASARSIPKCRARAATMRPNFLIMLRPNQVHLRDRSVPLGLCRLRGYTAWRGVVLRCHTRVPSYSRGEAPALCCLFATAPPSLSLRVASFGHSTRASESSTLLPPCAPLPGRVWLRGLGGFWCVALQSTLAVTLLGAPCFAAHCLPATAAGGRTAQCRPSYPKPP